MIEVYAFHWCGSAIYYTPDVEDISSAIAAELISPDSYPDTVLKLIQAGF